MLNVHVTKPFFKKFLLDHRDKPLVSRFFNVIIKYKISVYKIMKCDHLTSGVEVSYGTALCYARWF